MVLDADMRLVKKGTTKSWSLRFELVNWLPSDGAFTEGGMFQSITL